MKLYIAVLDEFPDYMTPTLVAHSVLTYHLKTINSDIKDKYQWYLDKSFKKVVVRVNQKEFEIVCSLDNVHIGHENNTLGGQPACAVWLNENQLTLPNVLRYAKLWSPKERL